MSKNTNYATIWSNPKTRDRLCEIAKARDRSMTEQLDVMVYQEWLAIFGKLEKLQGQEVVVVTVLPGSEAHKELPVVYVQPIRE